MKENLPEWKSIKLKKKKNQIKLESKLGGKPSSNKIMFQKRTEVQILCFIYFYYGINKLKTVYNMHRSFIKN